MTSGPAAPHRVPVGVGPRLLWLPAGLYAAEAIALLAGLVTLGEPTMFLGGGLYAGLLLLTAGAAALRRTAGHTAAVILGALLAAAAPVVLASTDVTPGAVLAAAVLTAMPLGLLLAPAVLCWRRPLPRSDGLPWPEGWRRQEAAGVRRVEAGDVGLKGRGDDAVLPVRHMRTVTHREMRNGSGEILRAVAAGETVQVTNNGQIAAGDFASRQQLTGSVGGAGPGPTTAPSRRGLDHHSPPQGGAHERRVGRGCARALGICYLDTSAAMKLLVEEAEFAALAAHLQSAEGGRQLVASCLLHAEMHCAQTGTRTMSISRATGSCWTPSP